MPYTHNGNTRLYYETVGQGPPILMQHGFGGVTEMWRNDGYVDALRDQFTLILMDARGMGRSARPTDPQAYTAEKRVSDATTVLDNLGLKSAHLWGYSYGGMTGWHACRFAPHRFRSMVIGSASPFIDGVDGEPYPMGRWLASITMDEMIGTFQPMYGYNWTPEAEAHLRDQSLEALAAAWAFHKDPHPELFLDSLTIPIMGYAATGDEAMFKGLQQACQTVPNGRFVSVEGTRHLDAYFAQEQIIPLATAFINEIEAGLAKEAST